MIKKLIEVALPLEKINASAAYEKMPGIGAHPRGLHLWWARRPLAAARAVIWSSLVDDPSSHPEEFPTEEEQNKERQRLFRILEDLVKWENSNNEEVLNAAKAEIMKSTGGNPPTLLDPFAGGGAIPLEAQRLGLEAHAHDLNPVAVMINKAMIEIPPRFSGMSPVNPEDNKFGRDENIYKGAAGIAADVRYYGEWMKQEAFKRIGHLYPKVKDEQGKERTVIAWIWARTVKCPNPACGCQMPLASSFVLSKKKGNETWVEPVIDGDDVRYVVRKGKCPKEKETVKQGKGGSFKCIHCGSIAEKSYIHDAFINHEVSASLLAIVAEGDKGRLYISPIGKHILIAESAFPEWAPTEDMNTKCTDLVSGRGYGITQWKELFTNRQLTALTTFSELVGEAQKKAEQHALAAGMPDDDTPLADGGNGATAYGEAIGVYLAFAVDRTVDFSTSVSRWAATNEKAMNCFSKQAIPMTWDYPEVNIMGKCVGGFIPIVEYISSCISTLPSTHINGVVKQWDAQSDNGLRNIMISTDPPYYDNIGYADLSDFFYVWMRQALKQTYPKLFRTMLVPKAEELVATPYRFNGNKQKAKEFFEDGMYHTCQQLYLYARNDIPVTIYYAYKQSDTDSKNNQTASTGWETMLSSIIKAGFAITGTWPMRTEQTYRAIGMGTNALSSSIVLVCRKRPEDAQGTTRRGFVNELRRELRSALTKLQSSNIAPVDLAQSAIGPGIGVFSKYKQVLEADGTPMTVRTALQIINQELDVFFNEQDGVLDKESRFCVDLFTQYAFNEMKFGEADTLARAKNTSVDTMKAMDILQAEKGIVRLLTREEIPMKINDYKKNTWLLMQQLTHALETNGITECAKYVSEADASQAEYAKALAYRLYTISERKGWSQEAFAYNNLVVAWPEIQSAAADIRATIPQQLTFFDKEN